MHTDNPAIVILTICLVLFGLQFLVLEQTSPPAHAPVPADLFGAADAEAAAGGEFTIADVANAQPAELVAAGKRTIAKQDCATCHLVDQKLVGPPYQEIAARYRGDESAIPVLVERVRMGGSGVWGVAAMLPHAKLSDREIHKMLAWIMSLAEAAPRTGPIAELDQQIRAALSSNKWDANSGELMRQMWASFQKLYDHPAEPGAVIRIADKLPEAKSYDEFLGRFTSADSATTVTVSRDDDGRYLVTTGDRALPAAAYNNCIVFFSGEIVGSPYPTFGAKPYGELALQILIRAEGKFQLGSPRDNEWTTLSLAQ